MKHYLHATLPEPPKTSDSNKAAYLLAGIFIVFALTQLFGFDEFLELLPGFNFIGGASVAKIFGVIIVICEVFALPFLLGMRLNKTIRIVSMVMGWIVVAGWLKVALWVNLTENSVSNIGILGSKIQLIPGWWAVSFILALCVLAAWSSWGLWPLLRNKGNK